MRLRVTDLTKGFDAEAVITNHVAVDSKTNQFTPDGIFSEEIFGKGISGGMSFSCLCGRVSGRFHSGETCPDCGEQVKHRSSEISRQGWILLEPYFIINPFFYKQFERVVGKELEGIVRYDPKLDLDGNVQNPGGTYANLGMIRLRERFREVLDHFHMQNKKRASCREAYEFICEHEDLVWVDRYPVYSCLLRPAIVIQKQFTFAEENNFFNLMINNINTIKAKEGLEKTELSTLPLLAEIQFASNRLYEKVNSVLAGKTGFLRSTLLGSRVNFSVRTVIIPLPIGYEMGEVLYPYLAAVEMFKYEIINVLSRTTGSYQEASRIWFYATTCFSQRVYDILEELVERTEGGLSILLNRNPTIELGSILKVKIAGIKRDYNDLTLSISNHILALIAGDFDGDVITTVSLKDMALKDHFAPLEPRNLVVSQDTGKFNRKLALGKDYFMGLDSFLK